MLKRFISPLVIAFLVVNNFGFILIYFQLAYLFEQQAVQKIRAGIAMDNIVRISSSSEVEVLDEKEIRFRGKMYDVVWSQVAGDEKTFYCIADDNEDALNEFFSDQLDSNTNVPLKSAIKNIITEVILPDIISIEPYETNQNWPIGHVDKWAGFKSNVETPPPQIS